MSRYSEIYHGDEGTDLSSTGEGREQVMSVRNRIEVTQFFRVGLSGYSRVVGMEMRFEVSDMIVIQIVHRSVWSDRCGIQGRDMRVRSHVYTAHMASELLYICSGSALYNSGGLSDSGRTLRSDVVFWNGVNVINGEWYSVCAQWRFLLVWTMSGHWWSRRLQCSSLQYVHNSSWRSDTQSQDLEYSNSVSEACDIGHEKFPQCGGRDKKGQCMDVIAQMRCATEADKDGKAERGVAAEFLQREKGLRT
ncbi:hypothetical protein Tco_1391642 [Tanacetum coccineum]